MWKNGKNVPGGNVDEVPDEVPLLPVGQVEAGLRLLPLQDLEQEPAHQHHVGPVQGVQGGGQLVEVAGRLLGQVRVHRDLAVLQLGQVFEQRQHLPATK